MPSFTDSLRGYSFPIHQRDDFTCVYCGFDGRGWPDWLFLSRDQLLPKGHPLRDNPSYIKTASRPCNEFKNQETYKVEGKTPLEIIEQKRAAVRQSRQEYHDFWTKNVQQRPD